MSINSKDILEIHENDAIEAIEQKSMVMEPDI